MAYAGFLLLFLVLPLGILAVILRRRLLDRRYVVLAGVLMLIALVYMAPWDHIAAVWGLWAWANGRTLGLRWWAIPPEEYLFCVLEALLAITLTYAVLTSMGTKGDASVLSPYGRASKGDASVPTPYGRASKGDASVPTPHARPSKGDASVPTPLHTTPAPTRGEGRQRIRSGEADQEGRS
jgi:lycopene cyclase domain-containing protein